MDNTIVAISTASGNGGIGIIRISGKESFNIISKIFKPKNSTDKIIGYNMKYGNIVNPKSGEIIDEVLVSYFVHPKSFTTEDMCEINSHGGMIVEKRILELCIEYGATIAEPGEFTKRAFLNGRIDLSQAEGIIELINAKTEREAKESINQLSGRLSKKIGEVEAKMLDIIVDIEVSIDYPEYDIEEVGNVEAFNKLNEIYNLLVSLENSFSTGKILKDGIKTVILGKPNAGKSSLLNLMLDEERAIVSDIEGTTRDTIEEYINVEGVALKLIDTAGIRNTDNIIEKIGVNKSRELAETADLIIAIIDNSKDIDAEDEEILNIIKDKKAIIVFNKMDINNNNEYNENKIKKMNKPIVKMSAKSGERVEDLYKEIVNMFGINDICSGNEVLITNERHKLNICKSKDNIFKAIDTIRKDMPIDVVTIYIKEALESLGEITGKNVSEDIINQIFSKFCLGK